MTTSSDNHFVAQAVHDLGSALWFGGAVMGVAGVNKSGSDLSQGIDRIRVAGSAWSRFQPAQFGGIAATLLAGLRLTQVGGRRIALQKGFGSVGALKAGLAVAGADADRAAPRSRWPRRRDGRSRPRGRRRTTRGTPRGPDRSDRPNSGRRPGTSPDGRSHPLPRGIPPGVSRTSPGVSRYRHLDRGRGGHPDGDPSSGGTDDHQQ